MTHELGDEYRRDGPAAEQQEDLVWNLICDIVGVRYKAGADCRCQREITPKANNSRQERAGGCVQGRTADAICQDLLLSLPPLSHPQPAQVGREIYVHYYQTKTD